ncbi:MAG: RsmB/NOP family class I SAM-dependent RNA methyltransferase [Microbacteriaceae bacterium]
MSGVQPARRIALDVILAVRESDAYANLLLPVRLGRAKLSTADAALATELTYGTIRKQGYYDAVIALAAGRSVDKIDAPILDVLRLACHQLLSMRTAQHAAVDESVQLAKTVGSQSATGFVNGVLRTITRRSAEEWHQAAMSSAPNDDARLAIEHSHPVWIVRAFRQALAAEGAADELSDLLSADNIAPRVSLTALPGLSTVSELDAHQSMLSPLGAILDSGDPLEIQAVREGRARVQDEGSALAALVLSRSRPVSAGEKWLDLCAGPGGKAALLAAEAAVGGATLIANEIVPARAGLVRNTLSVFDPHPHVWETDGTAIGLSHPEEFDRILIDAPCTGLGALRRRPEARWRKVPRDVSELSRLQADLLDSGLGALAPGGILAYVTCSPHLAETKVIIESTLKKWGEAIVKMDTPAVLDGIISSPRVVDEHPRDQVEQVGSRPMHVQLWPHRDGTDAMFIQLLTKPSR